MASQDSFQWIIGVQVDQWCVEPLVTASDIADTDFGGLWFAGEADTGWGFSLENIRNIEGGITYFLLLYVYAADGSPVWYFGLGEGDGSSAPISFTMFQRSGYPRIRTGGLDDVTDTQAGTVTLTLVTPSNSLSAGNEISVDVTYQGPEGGDWVRTAVPVQRLSLER